MARSKDELNSELQKLEAHFKIGHGISVADTAVINVINEIFQEKVYDIILQRFRDWLISDLVNLMDVLDERIKAPEPVQIAEDKPKEQKPKRAKRGPKIN